MARYCWNSYEYTFDASVCFVLGSNHDLKMMMPNLELQEKFLNSGSSGVDSGASLSSSSANSSSLAGGGATAESVVASGGSNAPGSYHAAAAAHHHRSFRKLSCAGGRP